MTVSLLVVEAAASEVTSSIDAVDAEELEAEVEDMFQERRLWDR